VLIKFRQALRVEELAYAAGEVADLPAQAAIQIVRRGVAELAERERLRQPEQNRIRQPKGNRRSPSGHRFLDKAAGRSGRPPETER